MINLTKSARLRIDILKSLYYSSELSLTELSKLTFKSLPVVATAVTELIEEGYLIESGLAPSTGGRRPAIFHLNSKKSRYIISVAMDQMVSRLAIYDISRKCIYPVQQLRLNPFDDVDVLKKLTDFIIFHIKRSGVASERVLGLGIGMPGFVNSDKGINESLLYNQRINLKEYLSAEIGLPVYIDNDSSLIALAELKFGEGMGVKELMVVNIGWGTGLGMIVNGRIFRGHSGYAGEFSHIPLSSSNNLCSCGKRGCLEVDTSLLSMVQKAKEAIVAGADSSLKNRFKDDSLLAGDVFLEEAKKGDPLAVSVLFDAAFQLGKGLSTLIHIMNPERIVLSGRGAKAGKMFLPAIQQAINEFCIHKISEQTSLVVSSLGNDAELMGAANLVIDNTHFQ